MSHRLFHAPVHPSGPYFDTNHFDPHGGAAFPLNLRWAAEPRRDTNLNSIQPQQELTSPHCEWTEKMQLQEKWLQSPHR